MILLNLYGCHFEYAGVSSRKYGLIFANVETSRLTSLSGEAEAISIYNKRDKKNYFIGESFEKAALSFDLEVVTETDSPIEYTVRREIENWLFYRSDYCKLYIDIADDWELESFEYIDGAQKRLYLNCRFVNPRKLEYMDGVIGYRFTVECDSSMAWQDSITQTSTLNTSASVSYVTVNVDTDIADYTYPKVVITMGSSGGDITIINQTDDSTRFTSFVDIPANSQITMNGDGINYISGNYYMKFSDMNFIRLRRGENTFSIIGNVKRISFTWQNRRYIT